MQASTKEPQTLSLIEFQKEIDDINHKLSDIVSKYSITKGLSSDWFRGEFFIGVNLSELDGSVQVVSK